MALGISSILYQTQTRGAVNLSQLKACIGEEIKVITELYFDKVFICDDVNDRVVRFVPTADNSGTLYNANVAYFSDPEFLNNSKVGDLFTSSDGNGTVPFTLLEVLNGGLAGRFDKNFIQNGLNTPDEYVANITALKSLIYQYNIGEAGDFVSQVDGSLQKFVADSATALTGVTLNMEASGDKDWQIDSISSVGLGDDPNFPANTHVRIRTTHTVVVTPLYLAGQYDNLRLGVAPDYFKADNLIRYNAQIDWNKSSSFLDGDKRTVLEPAGQFGWFGMKYNGSASDYSIGSLTIQRISDSEFIDQLEYNEVEVKFIVTSTGENFHATESALVFGFNYLPEDEALYQKTGRLMSENFCFESKKFTPNGVTVNGPGFGTDSQVIKTIKGDILSATTMRVTARILFGADRVEILEQEDVAKYAMWIICERTSLDIEVCDKANLLIQVDEIHVQLTSIDLLEGVTKFLEHPYENVVNGADTLEAFPVDDITAKSDFSIDFTGLEDDGILLRSRTPSIVITHDTEAAITLDSVRINLDNFPTVGTEPAVQLIDFEQIRPYKIENGIRKSISLVRNYAEETDTVKKFSLNFPFMNRWEYWLQLAGVTSIPESLFDESVPFNGMNHLWNRLANSTGWTLKYRVTFEILQNGELFEQEFEYDLSSTDFETNTDWDNCTIKTYDIDTDDEITAGGKKFAYGEKNTLVRASFEKISGGTPDLENVAIVIWAEGYEGGGITEITRISSVYDVTSVSAFKSVDDSNKVIVTQDGDTFIGEALLNFDKIKNFSRITLYARLYHPVVDIEEFARITNDEILRYTTDDQVRLINYGDDMVPINEMSGLVLRLKSSEISGSNNDPISTWPDTAGGNDAIGVGATRPILKTNVLNGKPVVEFDGTDDYLSIPSIIYRTIIVVGRSYQSPFNDYRGILGGAIDSVEVGGHLINAVDASEGLAKGVLLSDFSVMQRNGVDVLGDGNFSPVDEYWIGSFVYTSDREQQADLGRIAGGGRYWIGAFADVIAFDRELSSEELTAALLELSEEYEITI
jgi:hypothetical protein